MDFNKKKTSFDSAKIKSSPFQISNFKTAVGVTFL